MALFVAGFHAQALASRSRAWVVGCCPLMSLERRLRGFFYCSLHCRAWVASPCHFTPESPPSLSTALSNFPFPFSLSPSAQADNVGSNQLAKIRFALRGSATVLMGKNTMIRKIISLYIKDNPGHPLEMVRHLSSHPSLLIFVGCGLACRVSIQLQ